MAIEWSSAERENPKRSLVFVAFISWENSDESPSWWTPLKIKTEPLSSASFENGAETKRSETPSYEKFR